MNEQIIETSKVALWLNHVKNNRIEYLVLGLIVHTLGGFDVLMQHTQGVCS